MTATVLVLVSVLVVLSLVTLGLPALPRRATTVLAAGGLALLGLLGLLAVVGGGTLDPHGTSARVLLVELFLVAVVGGGPVTASVLTLADGGSGNGMARAGEVLRGGAWIGVFERAAVFATLAAGWPEGLAAVLALKGLGRYSELKGPAPQPGQPATSPSGAVAERFLIGSFASLLWACACAGALLGLVPGR